MNMVDEPIEQVVMELQKAGYRFRFRNIMEAIVDKPDGCTSYAVSLSCETLPFGCSCDAGHHNRMCRHRRIVEHIANISQLKEGDKYLIERECLSRTN